ncbi:pseudoazurin [Sphingosinicella sp. BN140058]|uniref:pseudoazurin n=1 Tax=Sphingosinicella sp. BN140058 TaxID=1892855 RepID=UPI001011B8FA|nr:pseudoazurin [Sphingosinicella sp. BN140058]QAY77554.1 pseudoazurin [Sphingosinicella sp. BN140058]
MKITFAAGALLAALALSASPAAAREWQVKMLNKGSDGKLMVFEPAFLKVAPGDTVKFLATQKGHNAETVAGMTPAGGPTFKGKINEEIVIKFTQQGLYGYKCLPHVGMGMVGLIQVGNAANKPAATAAAAKLPGMGKKNMTGLLAQAR